MMKSKGLKIAYWTIGILAIFTYFYWFMPFWGIPFNAQRHGNPPLTPAWALECWVWEDDVNTSEYVDELLAGYKAHDIPVRTILLDSPWSMRYNDFEIDTMRYRNPTTWFKTLEDDGYRVVLWMTSMVDSYSKDAHIKEDKEWYAQAQNSGFLAQSDTPMKWWKGKGGFIDYSNPEAMKWWHELQNEVFNLGIDGWKLDGTATLFREQLGPIPIFYKKTAKGLMSTRSYMDLYYREEYQHGLTRNKAFITLSRALDRGFHPEGFAPIDASPVNWVGDQEHKWVTDEMIAQSGDSKKDIALDGIQGFESAIDNILGSAELGYNIIGSDIAGFSGRRIPPRLYIRWTQFSAFCGLFLNGGHGERRLWKRTAEELEIIRKYSWLHTELVPYMYHYVVTAHEGGRRLQTPLSKGRYHYMFGDDFLIAPIYKDAKTVQIVLPGGKWRYFFGDSDLIQGPITFEKSFSLEEFPVYIKEGAIIPMAVKRGYTGLGDNASEGFTTILIFPYGQNSFDYYHPNTDLKTRISYALTGNVLKVAIKGAKIPHILRIHAMASPLGITLDGESLPFSSWTYDDVLKKVSIKTNPDYLEGDYIIKF